MAVLLLVIWLARKGKVLGMYLLLVGIGIAAMMDGVMHMVKLSGDPRLEAMLSWLSGTMIALSLAPCGILSALPSFYLPSAYCLPNS